MTYGKALCAIDSEHGKIFVTVASTTSIKQGNDLIRMTAAEAYELHLDLGEALQALERGETAGAPKGTPAALGELD